MCMAFFSHAMWMRSWYIPGFTQCSNPYSVWIANLVNLNILWGLSNMKGFIIINFWSPLVHPPERIWLFINYGHLPLAARLQGHYVHDIVRLCKYVHIIHFWHRTHPPSSLHIVIFGVGVCRFPEIRYKVENNFWGSITCQCAYVIVLLQIFNKDPFCSL